MADAFDGVSRQTESPQFVPQFDSVRGVLAGPEGNSLAKPPGVVCDSNTCHLPALEIGEKGGHKGAGAVRPDEATRSESTVRSDGSAGPEDRADPAAARLHDAAAKLDQAAAHLEASGRVQAVEKQDNRLYGGHTRSELAGICDERHRLSQQRHTAAAEAPQVSSSDGTATKMAGQERPEQQNHTSRPEVRREYAESEVKEAVQRAAREGKEVVLKVSAPWCGGCRSMEGSWKDQQVRDLMDKSGIKVNLDADSSQLARTLGVKLLPTVFVVSPNKNGTIGPDDVVNTSVGPLSAEALKKFLIQSGVHNR